MFVIRSISKLLKDPISKLFCHIFVSIGIQRWNFPIWLFNEYFARNAGILVIISYKDTIGDQSQSNISDNKSLPSEIEGKEDIVQQDIQGALSG